MLVTSTISPCQRSCAPSASNTGSAVSRTQITSPSARRIRYSIEYGGSGDWSSTQLITRAKSSGWIVRSQNVFGSAAHSSGGWPSRWRMPSGLGMLDRPSGFVT